MVKRVMSGMFGVLALGVAFICACEAWAVSQDFRLPDSLWSTLLGIVVWAGFAITACAVGTRFLSFSYTGKEPKRSTTSQALLRGIACIIPGFAFSFLLVAVMVHFCPSIEGAGDTLLGACGLIGVLTAIIASIVLVRRSQHEMR